MKIKNILFTGILSLFSGTNIAIAQDAPELFLFLGGNKASSYEQVLKKNNCILGAQIINNDENSAVAKSKFDTALGYVS
jgi:hypothetical protein